jgi:peptidoglycan/xylan/chitin deacetylase (PgdA/CDA1 family)
VYEIRETILAAQALSCRRVAAGAAPEWARGLRVSLPESVWSHLERGEEARINADAIQEVRLLAAYTDNAPLSSRLPFSYQYAPAWARTLLAGFLGRWQRGREDNWASFPVWPLDLSADFLADALQSSRSPHAAGPTPVILSHDLDSPEGLRNLVADFLDLEERAGARSVNFVVPCAWPLDHRLLAEVRDRGHEIGVHGYDHSNRTPFAGAEERARRLNAAREFIDRYSVVGYRAPSLLRTRALIQGLRGLYRYDSSVPTSGGLFPVPNNGCATARPFVLDGMSELPVSLPRDGSLLFLGHGPGEIVRLWIECADTISRSGGVVVLLTHCEARFSGGPEMRAAYREFLDYVRSSDRFSFSTPLEVLSRTQP